MFDRSLRFFQPGRYRRDEDRHDQHDEQLLQVPFQARQQTAAIRAEPRDARHRTHPRGAVRSILDRRPRLCSFSVSAAPQYPSSRLIKPAGLAGLMTPDIGQQHLERTLRCGHRANVRGQPDLWVLPEAMIRRWWFFVEHVEIGVAQLPALPFNAAKEIRGRYLDDCHDQRKVSVLV